MSVVKDLSPRESEVAKMLTSGMADKEIARDLGLAPITVKIHQRRLREKLGARNRTHAAVLFDRQSSTDKETT